MLSRFAKLLLVSTSLAPVLLVYAATQLPENLWIALYCVSAALMLVLICRLLLALVERTVPAERLVVEEAEIKDSDILAFLVAYALPLIAVGEDQSVSSWGLGAFLVLAAIVLSKCNLYHVNPLLGLLEYHFFSIKTSSGHKYLLLSQRETLLPGDVFGAKVTSTLFLDKG